MGVIKYKGSPMDGGSAKNKGQGDNSDQQIKVVIHFNERIDAELMERTLHAITYREPILSCTYVSEDFFKGHWEKMQDMEQQKLLELIETENGQDAAMKFISEAVDVEKAHYLRVCLIRTSTSDILCLRVNHGLADGGGTKEIAYLIADTYKKMSENLNLEFKQERFKKRSLLGIIKYKGPFTISEDQMPPWVYRILKENQISKNPGEDNENAPNEGKEGENIPNEGEKNEGEGNQEAFPEPCFRLPFKKEPKNEGEAYALRSIEPEEFLKLKAYGKQQAVTINDLILAALFRTLCKVSNVPEGTPYSIQISSDIRSSLPKETGYTISNLFGIHFPVFQCHPEESFQDTLASVCEKMKDVRKEASNMDEVIKRDLMVLTFKKLIARKKFQFPKDGNFERPATDTTHIISSNFTTLDKDKMDFGIGIKDAFQVGTISYGKEFMLCSSTYNNRMTLSNGYCESDIDKIVIDEVMDSIVNELKSCIYR